MKNIVIDSQNFFTKTQNFYMQHPWPLVLLAIIAVSTALSGFLGFKLGDQALKGVSQPEINPTQKLDKPLRPDIKSDKKMTVFQAVDEQKIVNQVKSYIASKSEKSQVATNSTKKTNGEKTQSPPVKSEPATKKN